MSASLSPGKEVPAEDQVVLNVLLNCEETRSSETKQVHFQSLPTTPLEIKKKIEEDFSIPSCVQTLHYQSMILKDSDQLQYTHFRSGDTFTVDYPIEGECEKVQTAIKWLKELCEVLEESLSPVNEKNEQLMFSNSVKLGDLILEDDESFRECGLYYTLFSPWADKKKLVNKFYFYQEDGLNVLINVYSILLSREWGAIMSLFEEFHAYLESLFAMAISRYAATLPLCRHIFQLGGLEMCAKTVLRRKLLEGEKVEVIEHQALYCALLAICNLSDHPECQVPLAMKPLVIDQILAMAMHSSYNCEKAQVSIGVLMNVTHSPKAHRFIVREGVVKKMLQVCELKQAMISEQQLSQSQQGREDPVAITILKYHTSIVLAQIALGSPHRLFNSTPSHLLQQIVDLISEVLEALSPAQVCQYEEDEGWISNRFHPYLQYLYEPSPIKSSDGRDVKENLLSGCCNILLHRLESALRREVHLEILVKERLLDYTMCLPAVFPGECQPRARSLINELGKHRQLQPPSLCTLAKAHIAKTFCGLQPIMEMKSIGEFLYGLDKGTSLD